MAFSEEEKDLIVQSLQFYLQQGGAQLPPQAMERLMGMLLIMLAVEMVIGGLITLL